ncbi:ABC transporter permease [Candidatus Electronema sp. JM]|uniref:ABC transporter permease n=1 Tax=Candidatus Electronema sp. JM TaxID=3401571 RepID=UPI003AA98C0A
MLVRKLGQFFFIYCLGLAFLLGLKYFFGLSNYVLPDIHLLVVTAGQVVKDYVAAVFSTLAVTVLGQFISIALAFAVGIAGRKSSWLGSLIRAAAYSIQSYPIVALAPIIFILLGDGFLSRLLIASMICYFPLLLSVLGIMAAPVEDIEQFYRATGRMTWLLEVKIRAFENLSKLSTVISGSASLALAGTIVAEFIAAEAGIGYCIRTALYQSDMAKILTALFLIGIVISLYQGVLETIGARLTRAWSGA